MDFIYCCPYVICVMTSASPVEQVRQLLVDDPGNSEYVDMERELKEVVLVLWLYSFGFSFSIPYKICLDIYMISYKSIYMGSLLSLVCHLRFE
jgi:hypothetical protein